MADEVDHLLSRAERDRWKNNNVLDQVESDAEKRDAERAYLDSGLL